MYDGGLINGYLRGSVQVEGRNALCALVLLTPWPQDKPLHRLNFYLNEVHSSFSADALTAGISSHSEFLFFDSAYWLLKDKQAAIRAALGWWPFGQSEHVGIAPLLIVFTRRGLGPDGSVTQWNTGQHPLPGYLATMQRAVWVVKGVISNCRVITP